MAVLEKRAEEFAAITLKTFDDRNIPLLVIVAETEAPMGADFFAGLPREEVMGPLEAKGLSCRPEEYMPYENPGMCAHRLLATCAQMHRAGEKAQAAALARRVFAGLCAVNEMGDRTEKGLMCKPYGQKPSTETSHDEIFGQTMALWIYYEVFADEGDKKRVIDQLVATSDWTIRHDFKYPYFGKPGNMYPWVEGSGNRTFLLKFPMTFHAAGRFGGRPDLLHLSLCWLHRSRRLLDWHDEDGSLRVKSARGAENVYQWQDGAGYFCEQRVELDAFAWRKFTLDCPAALKAIFLEGADDSPYARLAWLNCAMKAEALRPGAIRPEEARAVLEAADRDAFCSARRGDRRPNPPRLLHCKAFHHWLEAYWRGCAFGWW